MMIKTRPGLRAAMAFFAAFALGLTAAFAEVDTATNRPPVQTFYLPIPEEDLLQTLTSIHGGASWTLPAEPVASYNSIVVFVDGTVIYYDQWEDGYERTPRARRSGAMATPPTAIRPTTRTTSSTRAT